MSGQFENGSLTSFIIDTHHKPHDLFKRDFMTI